MRTTVAYLPTHNTGHTSSGKASQEISCVPSLNQLPSANLSVSHGTCCCVSTGTKQWTVCQCGLDDTAASAFGIHTKTTPLIFSQRAVLCEIDFFHGDSFARCSLPLRWLMSQRIQLCPETPAHCNELLKQTKKKPVINTWIGMRHFNHLNISKID